MSPILQQPRKPRQQVLLAGRSIISESFHPSANLVTTSAPTSKTVYGSLVPLLAGEVITNLLFMVGTAAAGTPPTRVECGIYSSNGFNAGVSLATSGDVGASAQWLSTGTAQIPCPYVVPVDGVYFIVFMQDLTATWGTTPLKLAYLIVNNFNTLSIATVGARLTSTFGTTATSLVTVGNATPAPGNSGAFYIYAGVN